MIISRALGQASLQLAFFLYLGMLLPQVFHNLRRNSTVGLSWFMHLLLVIGSIADVGYGVGLAMPWQYYCVSLVSLFMIAIQHAQFYFYHREHPPRNYVATTAAFIFSIVIITLSFGNSESFKKFYITLGYISMFSWIIYPIPQIIKTQRIRNVDGLSLSFVLLGISGNIFDTISAYGLNFALPNKIGAPATLILKLILLFQYLKYRRSVGSNELASV